LVQIKSSKNTELVEAENLYKKTLKRLIAIEDDEVAKNLISDANSPLQPILYSLMILFEPTLRFLSLNFLSLKYWSAEY